MNFTALSSLSLTHTFSTMTSFQLTCLFFLISTTNIFCFSTSVNQSLKRLKRADKQTSGYNPFEKLVYSTKTQLQVLSPLWSPADDKVATQFSTILEEQSYVINSFDLSFQEGLAFYGIDELFVRPIG